MTSEMKPGRGEKLSVAEVEQLSSEHGKQVEASAAGSQLGGDFKEFRVSTIKEPSTHAQLPYHRCITSCHPGRSICIDATYTATSVVSHAPA